MQKIFKKYADFYCGGYMELLYMGMKKATN